MKHAAIIFMIALVGFSPTSSRATCPEYAHFSSLTLHPAPTSKNVSKKNNSITWHVKSLPHQFTELLLSWNASRPRTGLLSFFTNVKHKGVWSGFQKMAEWGKGAQKSFLENGHPHVQTKHVRVELQSKNVLGEEFEVEVRAEGGASINDIKALHVCTTNNNLFNYKKSIIDLPSLTISGIPRFSQMHIPHPRFADMCSPTATHMIVHYWLGKKFIKPRSHANHHPLAESAADFAQQAYDQSYLNIYGNWPFNIAHAFDVSQGKLHSSLQRLNTFHDLYDYLKRGIPVAVSIRGVLRNAFKEYNNGHFVVVVGWDQKHQRVLCIDPAFTEKEEMLRPYYFDDFAFAWAKSRHLAYVIKPI